MYIFDVPKYTLCLSVRVSKKLSKCKGRKHRIKLRSHYKITDALLTTPIKVDFLLLKDISFNGNFQTTERVRKKKKKL